MASRLPLLRRFCTILKPPPSTPVGTSRVSRALLLRQASAPNYSPRSFASSRSFCSGPLSVPHDSVGPAAIDYCLVLQEDEFHRYLIPQTMTFKKNLSGPSRFDWDHNAQAWVYRRTKANLAKLLESELAQLCGEPVNLS